MRNAASHGYHDFNTSGPMTFFRTHEGERNRRRRGTAHQLFQSLYTNQLDRSRFKFEAAKPPPSAALKGTHQGREKPQSKAARKANRET